LQYRAYQDEEGKARGVAEIVAGDVRFLSGRRGEPIPGGDDQGAAEDAIDLDELPL
jgi:single-stranded DNA-binding protein